MDPTSVKIHPAWQKALAAEFTQNYFDKITASLKQTKLENKQIYPAGSAIFAAYDACPPDSVKVVILGQDPYHNPGEAMGLSFSVPKGVKIPASLRNVYKELSTDVWCTPPPHGDLTVWAQQGVFLLNAMLTVEHNNPGSHKAIGWQQFTDATIRYLSKHQSGIVFMLWGNFARSKKILIDDTRHLILEAAHPSPLARNAFQGCKHFSKANAYLQAIGKNSIDWQIR